MNLSACSPHLVDGAARVAFSAVSTAALVALTKKNDRSCSILLGTGVAYDLLVPPLAKCIATSLHDHRLHLPLPADLWAGAQDATVTTAGILTLLAVQTWAGKGPPREGAAACGILAGPLAMRGLLELAGPQIGMGAAAIPTLYVGFVIFGLFVGLTGGGRSG